MVGWVAVDSDVGQDLFNFRDFGFVVAQAVSIGLGIVEESAADATFVRDDEAIHVEMALVTAFDEFAEDDRQEHAGVELVTYDVGPGVQCPLR